MAEQPAKVALGLGSLNPTEVLTLTSTVVQNMTGNDLFPAPTVKLTDLAQKASEYSREEADIASAEAKLKARRTTNKGTLNELKKLLTTQGNYVNGIADGSRATIEAAGMPASAEPTPVGKLPRVAGLVLAPGGAKGQVLVKWDAVSRRDGGSGYMVHSGLTPGSMTSKEYAHTASLTLTGLPSGQEAWVCVQVLGKDPGDCCQPQSQMVP